MRLEIGRAAGIGDVASVVHGSEGGYMRRRALTVTTVVVLMVGVLALPAPAAIHELVASHCAGEELPNNGANIDPRGQTREGQSFLRALQASGLYDITFGEDPAGNTGQFVTIRLDDERPSSKFSWDGTSFFSFPVPGIGTVFVPLADPDHPAFENCANLQP